MNIDELIAQIEQEIVQKLKEIEDAKVILAKLKSDAAPAQPVADSGSVLAIGDSPRSCVLALCQTRDLGQPVDYKNLDSLIPGATWGMSFSAERINYVAYGRAIPGGLALTSFNTQEALYES